MFPQRWEKTRPNEFVLLNPPKGFRVVMRQVNNELVEADLFDETRELSRVPVKRASGSPAQCLLIVRRWIRCAMV
jgi:hypothetical protein